MSALIDATRVREHLEALGLAGMGKRAIAKASGVPRYETLDAAEALST